MTRICFTSVGILLSMDPTVVDQSNLMGVTMIIEMDDHLPGGFYSTCTLYTKYPSGEKLLHFRSLQVADLFVIFSYMLIF